MQCPSFGRLFVPPGDWHAAAGRRSELLLPDQVEAETLKIPHESEAGEPTEDIQDVPLAGVVEKERRQELVQLACCLPLQRGDGQHPPEDVAKLRLPDVGRGAIADRIPAIPGALGADEEHLGCLLVLPTQPRLQGHPVRLFLVLGRDDGAHPSVLIEECRQLVDDVSVHLRLLRWDEKHSILLLMELVRLCSFWRNW